MEIVKLLEKGFIEIATVMRDANSISLGNITEHNNTSGDDVKTMDLISNAILMDILMKPVEGMNCLNLFKNLQIVLSFHPMKEGIRQKKISLIKIIFPSFLMQNLDSVLIK